MSIDKNNVQKRMPDDYTLNMNPEQLSALQHSYQAAAVPANAHLLSSLINELHARCTQVTDQEGFDMVRTIERTATAAKRRDIIDMLHARSDVRRWVAAHGAMVNVQSLEAAVDSDSASTLTEAIGDATINADVLAALLFRAVRGAKYGAWRVLTQNYGHGDLSLCTDYVNEVARTKDCPNDVVENVCTLIGAAFDSGALELAKVLDLMTKLVTMASENENTAGLRQFNTLYLHYLRASQAVAKDSAKEGIAKPPKKRRFGHAKRVIESSSDEDTEDEDSDTDSESSSSEVSVDYRVEKRKFSGANATKQHIEKMHREFISNIFAYDAANLMTSTEGRNALNHALAKAGLPPLSDSRKFKMYLIDHFRSHVAIPIGANKGSAYRISLKAQR